MNLEEELAWEVTEAIYRRDNYDNVKYLFNIYVRIYNQLIEKDKKLFDKRLTFTLIIFLLTTYNTLPQASRNYLGFRAYAPNKSVNSWFALCGPLTRRTKLLTAWSLVPPD